MNTFLTATAMAVGLPIARVAPSDDVWEWTAQSSDDEWTDLLTQPEEADSGPGVPLQHAVLTRAERLPTAAVGQAFGESYSMQDTQPSTSVPSKAI